MKICLINHAWQPQPKSGAEQVVATIAAAARSAGHRVVIIAARPLGPQPVVPNGETVYFLPSWYGRHAAWPYWRRLAWHALAFANPLAMFRISRILGKEKPDLVWTHNLLGFGLAPLGLGRRFRHLHSIHDIQLLHPSGLLMRGREGMIATPLARAYQLLVRRFISPATRIISPSQWLLSLHRQQKLFIPNRCDVIPNPLPPAFVKALSPGESSERVSGDFLYVGQIEAHKGIELLLAAFSAVTGDTARLRLIGGGGLLAPLQAAEHDRRIEFLGILPSEQVKERMRQAGCLIVPSLCYENQPTVMLEAAACGLPVIASDFGGTQELLTDPELLFAPTVSALAGKIAWALAHPEELAARSTAAFKQHESLAPEAYLQRVLDIA